jgi:hypothetical protein
MKHAVTPLNLCGKALALGENMKNDFEIVEVEVAFLCTRALRDNIGHTVVRLSLAARINRRRRRPSTRILGSARVQNGYRTGTHLTNENSKFQRSLAFTFTFTFHYSSLLPTTSSFYSLACSHAQHFTFSPYHRK